MKKIVAILVGIGLYSGAVLGQVTAFSEGGLVGDFTVTDMEGHTHNLYDYCNAGNYVVLDFFAYWCGNCAQTAPKLNEFYRTYGCNSQNVKVIAVEADGNLGDVEAFEAATGGNTNFPHPTIVGQLGGSAVHSQFGVFGYPTICLISPNKILLDKQITPIIDGSDIAAAFPNGAISPHECSVSSVEEKADIGVEISPNPTSSALNIQVSGDWGTNRNTLVICDVLGQEVWRGDLQAQQTMDISRLATGCYFVHFLMDKHQTIVRKLWIQR